MEMTMYLTEVDGKYEKSLMKDYYVWKCRQGYWQWDAEYDDEICVMRVWNDEILSLCGKIC